MSNLDPKRYLSPLKRMRTLFDDLDVTTAPGSNKKSSSSGQAIPTSSSAPATKCSVPQTRSIVDQYKLWVASHSYHCRDVRGRELTRMMLLSVSFETHYIQIWKSLSATQCESSKYIKIFSVQLQRIFEQLVAANSKKVQRMTFISKTCMSAPLWESCASYISGTQILLALSLN